MKSMLTFAARPHNTIRHLLKKVRRNGSTLVVVVALMGMLSLLGVMFYAFANQEKENAQNFYDHARRAQDGGLGPDEYFDHFLRQFIVGPEYTEKNSMLWGGRHSLLPNAYGRDAHVHTGTGVTVDHDFNYNPVIDQDRDRYRNAADPTFLDADEINPANRQTFTQYLLEFNDSPAANFGFERNVEAFPEPDVDYTYPDINNTFLAYIGFTREPLNEDFNGNGVLDGDTTPGNGVFTEDLNDNGILDVNPLRRVIKPSFHVPGLLCRLEDADGDGALLNEDTNGNGVLDPGEDTNGNNILDIEDFNSNGIIDTEDVNGAGGLENEDANGNGILDPGEDTNGNGVLDTEDLNGNGATDGLVLRDSRWAYNGWTRNRVMRAHPDHVHARTRVRRYLDDRNPADAAIIAGLPGTSGGFPFINDPDGDGIANEQGVWSFTRPVPGQDFQYEYDVDNDQDGIDEGILMDLDFPIQERASDGALYIPMFSATVLDLDSLFNLNIHGNLSGNTAPALSPATFGGPAVGGIRPAISQSAQGLTPSEVNPIYGLDAHPNVEISSADMSDYLAYFGHEPVDRLEMANMTWWWLNKGRIETGAPGVSDQIHVGRLGDAQAVWQVANSGATPINLNTGDSRRLFPFPGILNGDDNRNFNEGGATFTSYGESVTLNTFGGRSLAFEHPLSFSGAGQMTATPATSALNATQRARRLNEITPIPNNPSWFIGYDGFGLAGRPTWADNFSAQFLPNSQVGVLYSQSPGPDGAWHTADDVPFDDMMEITLDKDNLQRPHDETFGPEEMAYLQLSAGDVSRKGVSSRLSKLMPSHIDPAVNSARAVAARKMFTSMSWDRKQLAYPRLIPSSTGGGPGTDGQPGQAGIDDNDDGVVDNLLELGYPGSDDGRAWEFSGDLDRDSRLEFPPANFNAGGTQIGPYAGFHEDSPYTGPGTVNPAGTFSPDPFRPQLRRLLETEFGNKTESRLQFRMSLNGITDVIRNRSNPGHPYYSTLDIRPLTAHSQDNTLATVTEVSPGNSVPLFPPTATSEADREFWARFDRQRLARDIYVLLYTLCGGVDHEIDVNGNGTVDPAEDINGNGVFDALDPRLNPGTVIYTPAQLREMAQFAVNYVDALDRDDVMTIFEYDTDLSDGWGLDDQWWAPASAAYDPAVATGQRAIVVGTESQQLTFSETLWVTQAQYTGMSTDNSHTPYDETAQNSHFLFAELRNTRPETVTLYEPGVTTNEATSVWRLVRRNVANRNNVPRISSANNVAAPENAIFFYDDTDNQVQPGELFSISTADRDGAPASMNTSDLYVDYNVSSPASFDLIAPRRAGVTISSSDTPNPECDVDLLFDAASGKFKLENDTTPDEFLNDANAPGGSFALVLERRLNPKQPQIPVTANPWVAVDVTIVQQQQFDLNDSDTTQGAITTKLANLVSTEYEEPFSMRTTPVHPGDATNSRFNSIRSAQTLGSGDNSNSLALPNSRFTQHNFQAIFNRDFASPIELLSISLLGPRDAVPAVARGRRTPLEQQNNANGPSLAAAKFLLPQSPSGQYNLNNRWHRLLSFVEVPTRTHRQLGNPLDQVRVPGKLNPNTMRHPEVLGGWLDESAAYHIPERDVNGDGLVTATVPPTDDPNGNSQFDYGLKDRDTANDPFRDYWFDMLQSRDGFDPVSYMALPGTSASRPFRDTGFMGDGDGSVEHTLLRAHPRDTSNTVASTRRLFEIGTDAQHDTSGINSYNRHRLLSKLANNATTRSNVFVVFLTVRFHEVYEDPVSGAIRIGGQFDLNEDSDVNNDEHRGFFVIDRSRAEDAFDGKEFSDWEDLVDYRLTIN